MIDLVKLLLKAGNGGHGRISFRREKYVPKGGPDGGQGGSGGDIVIRATNHKNTLAEFAGVKEIAAEPGQAGSKRQRTGYKGEDTIIEVPVGTTIWQLASNQTAHRREMGDGSLREKLYRGEATFHRYEVETEASPIPTRDSDDIVADEANQQLLQLSLKNLDLKHLERTEVVTLSEAGQEIVICQGGFGGRGNESFKSPARTTPLLAEYGTFGEQRLVLFELQLLADVGLVGLPNAGKSTLLSRVTKANPRVASYPFTTLEPQLGVWSNQGKELVLADIPGLISGASKGQGLGYEFLRHIKACEALVYVLAPALEDIELFQSQKLDASTKKELLAYLNEQKQTLQAELKAYNPELLHKKSLEAINKIDLFSPEVTDFLSQETEYVCISGATSIGLDELFKRLR